MVYFDNAATTYPKPVEVLKAMERAFVYYGANPGRSGHKLSMDTALQIFECRELLAEMFGARSAEDVVFTQNCTHSLNIAIKGILKHGDHAIISDIEHNSVLRPMEELKARGIIDYDIAEIAKTSEETVENYRKLIRPETKLIVVSHGSNAFGIMSPIEELAKLSHKYDTYILVDAAQSAGVIDINVQKLGIDFLCMPGHKGLYGPTGTGVLITSAGEELSTIMEGGTGSMSLEYRQPRFMPDMLESGTINTFGIIALKAGIKYIQKIGIDNIYTHEMKIIESIYKSLSQSEKVKLYAPPPEMYKSLPVLSFNLLDYTGEKMAEILNQHEYCIRGGYHCSPLAHKKMNTLDTGTARISVGTFNNLSQANALCVLIKNL